MDLEDCQDTVDELVENDSRIRGLIEAVRAKVHFEVEVCDCTEDHGAASSFARAYFAAPNLKDLTSEEQPRIVMCANELRSRGEVREALRHELVHAFDHCVSRRDLAEPNGLACSEIRAAREAECRDNFHNILGELFCKAFVGADAFADKQDNMICKQLKESCARQVATTSIRAVFPAEGYTCIKAQFDKCYNDLAPFGQNDEHSSREGAKPTAS